MLNISKFLSSNTGKYIISILLGIGLASLFRSVCKDKNCILFYIPPLTEINNQVYQFNDKCYSYESKAVTCNNSKKVTMNNDNNL
jgi:hypothetical protein